MDNIMVHFLSGSKHVNQDEVDEIWTSQSTWMIQGLLNVPFWEYWTSPKKVAIIDIYRPYT